MLASAKRGNILKNLLVRPDMWLDSERLLSPHEDNVSACLFESVL
jgi:hypothetical protein